MDSDADKVGYDKRRADHIERFDCGCCFVVYLHRDHSTDARVFRRCAHHAKADRDRR